MKLRVQVVIESDDDDGKLVIVNLNAFDIGEDVAALVGGTLLNLAAAPPRARRSCHRTPASR